MIPSSFNKQIQDMFYKDGFSVEQIAESLEFDVTAVTLVINQVKPRNVKEERRESALTALHDYRERALEVIGELMDAENEAVRYKAAEFILEAELDMKQPPAKVVPQSNVLVFQQMLAQANASYDAQVKRLREEKKVIDITSSAGDGGSDIVQPPVAQLKQA